MRRACWANPEAGRSSIPSCVRRHCGNLWQAPAVQSLLVDPVDDILTVHSFQGVSAERAIAFFGKVRRQARDTLADLIEGLRQITAGCGFGGGGYQVGASLNGKARETFSSHRDL